MSSEQPRRSSRDTTGSVASPMGSTAAIIIAVVAVVAGFLILRSIRGDDGDNSVAPIDTQVTLPSTESTSAPVVESTLPPDTTPTTIAPVTEGATVVVANASRVDGAAGVFTTALEGQGFVVGTATNAGGSEPKLEVSKIYYDPANASALPVAQYLASLMGNVEVLEIVAPPPVVDGALAEGVTVLVMLGSDKAALTLEQMSVPVVTTTTVAGAVVETTTTVAAP